MFLNLNFEIQNKTNYNVTIVMEEYINKKGFTLIELLSVIIILGVILAIAVPQILNVIDNTKETLNNFIGVDATKYDSFGVDLVNNEVVVTIQKGDYIGEKQNKC